MEQEQTKATLLIWLFLSISLLLNSVNYFIISIIYHLHHTYITQLQHTNVKGSFFLKMRYFFRIDNILWHFCIYLGNLIQGHPVLQSMWKLLVSWKCIIKNYIYIYTSSSFQTVAKSYNSYPSVWVVSRSHSNGSKILLLLLL